MAVKNEERQAHIQAGAASVLVKVTSTVPEANCYGGLYHRTGFAGLTMGRRLVLRAMRNLACTPWHVS